MFLGWVLRLGSGSPVTKKRIGVTASNKQCCRDFAFFCSSTSIFAFKRRQKHTHTHTRQQGENGELNFRKTLLEEWSALASTKSSLDDCV